nr:putative metalloprotease CJM1_0395 family protein [Halomonas nitroreducens]
MAGEVPFDYGEVKGAPQATIETMQQIIAAALAPTDTLTKDHQVAAQASQKLLTAQLELAQQRGEIEQAREGNRTRPSVA